MFAALRAGSSACLASRTSVLRQAGGVLGLPRLVIPTLATGSDSSNAVPSTSVGNRAPAASVPALGASGHVAHFHSSAIVAGGRHSTTVPERVRHWRKHISKKAQRRYKKQRERAVVAARDRRAGEISAGSPGVTNALAPAQTLPALPGPTALARMSEQNRVIIESLLMPDAAATPGAGGASGFDGKLTEAEADALLKALVDGRVPRERAAAQSVLNALGKAGRFEDALGLFARMRAWGIPPDTIEFNSLILASAQQRNVAAAFSVVESMTAAGVTHDAVTYGGLMQACIRTGDLARAFEQLRAAELAGVALNTVLFTHLLTGCVHAGEYERAWLVWEHMRTYHCEPDTVAFTTMITACARRDEVEKALHLLTEMKQMGLPLTAVTYNAAIHCAARSFRRAAHAHALFSEMAVAGHARDDRTYASVILACSHTGDVAKARHYMWQMAKEGIQPSLLTLNCLLAVYMRALRPAHKNAERDADAAAMIRSDAKATELLQLEDPKSAAKLLAGRTRVLGDHARIVEGDPRQLVENLLADYYQPDESGSKVNRAGGRSIHHDDPDIELKSPQAIISSAVELADRDPVSFGVHTDAADAVAAVKDAFVEEDHNDPGYIAAREALIKEFGADPAIFAEIEAEEERALSLDPAFEAAAEEAAEAAQRARRLSSAAAALDQLDVEAAIAQETTAADATAVRLALRLGIDLSGTRLGGAQALARQRIEEAAAARRKETEANAAKAKANGDKGDKAAAAAAAAATSAAGGEVTHTSGSAVPGAASSTAKASVIDTVSEVVSRAEAEADSDSAASGSDAESDAAAANVAGGRWRGRRGQALRRSGASSSAAADAAAAAAAPTLSAGDGTALAAGAGDDKSKSGRTAASALVPAVPGIVAPNAPVRERLFGGNDELEKLAREVLSGEGGVIFDDMLVAVQRRMGVAVEDPAADAAGAVAAHQAEKASKEYAAAKKGGDKGKGMDGKGGDEGSDVEGGRKGGRRRPKRKTASGPGAAGAAINSDGEVESLLRSDGSQVVGTMVLPPPKPGSGGRMRFRDYLRALEKSIEADIFGPGGMAAAGAASQALNRTRAALEQLSGVRVPYEIAAAAVPRLGEPLTYAAAAAVLETAPGLLTDAARERVRETVALAESQAAAAGQLVLPGGGAAAPQITDGTSPAGSAASTVAAGGAGAVPPPTVIVTETGLSVRDGPTARPTAVLVPAVAFVRDAGASGARIDPAPETALIPGAAGAGAGAVVPGAASGGPLITIPTASLFEDSDVEIGGEKLSKLTDIREIPIPDTSDTEGDHDMLKLHRHFAEKTMERVMLALEREYGSASSSETEADAEGGGGSSATRTGLEGGVSGQGRRLGGMGVKRNAPLVLGPAAELTGPRGSSSARRAAASDAENYETPASDWSRSESEDDSAAEAGITSRRDAAAVAAGQLVPTSAALTQAGVTMPVPLHMQGGVHMHQFAGNMQALMPPQRPALPASLAYAAVDDAGNVLLERVAAPATDDGVGTPRAAAAAAAAAGAGAGAGADGGAVELDPGAPPAPGLVRRRRSGVPSAPTAFMPRPASFAPSIAPPVPMPVHPSMQMPMPMPMPMQMPMPMPEHMVGMVGQSGQATGAANVPFDAASASAALYAPHMHLLTQASAPAGQVASLAVASGAAGAAAEVPAPTAGVAVFAAAAASGQAMPHTVGAAAPAWTSGQLQPQSPFSAAVGGSPAALSQQLPLYAGAAAAASALSSASVQSASTSSYVLTAAVGSGGHALSAVAPAPAAGMTIAAAAAAQEAAQTAALRATARREVADILLPASGVSPSSSSLASPAAVAEDIYGHLETDPVRAAARRKAVKAAAAAQAAALGPLARSSDPLAERKRVVGRALARLIRQERLPRLERSLVLAAEGVRQFRRRRAMEEEPSTMHALMAVQTLQEQAQAQQVQSQEQADRDIQGPLSGSEGATLGEASESAPSGINLKREAEDTRAAGSGKPASASTSTTATASSSLSPASGSASASRGEKLHAERQAAALQVASALTSAPGSKGEARMQALVQLSNNVLAGAHWLPPDPSVYQDAPLVLDEGMDKKAKAKAKAEAAASVDRNLRKLTILGELQAVYFEELPRLGLRPDLITLNTVLGALCAAGANSEAYAFLKKEYAAAGFKPDARSFRALIGMHVRQKASDKAEKVFALMKAHGIAPDKDCYGLLVHNRARDWRIKDSIALLKEMQAAGHTCTEYYAFLLRQRCKELGIHHPAVPAHPVAWQFTPAVMAKRRALTRMTRKIVQLLRPKIGKYR